MITPLLGMVYRESITTLRALAMCLVASKRQRAISLSAVLLLICHLASMNAVHAASELDHDYCERFKETVPVDERIAACNRILDDPKEPSPAIATAVLDPTRASARAIPCEAMSSMPRIIWREPSNIILRLLNGTPRAPLP